MLAVLSAFVTLWSSWAGAQTYTVYPGQLPPLNYRDDAGEWHGVVVDALTRMMQRCGVAFSRHNFQDAPWARAQLLAETVPGSVVISLARTPDREDRYLWVGPVVSLRLGLVARSSKALRIRDPKDLRQYEIAVIRESAPVSILRDTAGIPEEELHLVDNNMQQFRLLAADRVDMVTQADLATPLFLSELQIDSTDYEMVHVLKELPLYIALNRKTDPVLVLRLQEQLALMQKPGADGRSELDVLLQKHLGSPPLSLRAP